MKLVRRLAIVVLGVLVTGGAFLVAQPSSAPLPPQPPRPKKFAVTLRYRILAPRDQHVAQYDALIAHLKKIDFEFVPPLDEHPDTDREDPFKNSLQGNISADNAYRLLDNPSVAAVLLVPEGFKLPDDLDQPVRVRLDLTPGLSTDRQRELAEQVRAVLDHLAFREAVGYDHRGHTGRPFTRLVGTVPVGRLSVLLKDLRGQPAGWFAPRVPPGEVPEPLRTLSPVQVIEVLPDPEPITDVGEAPARDPAYLEKIETPLWALVQDKASQGREIRIELVFQGDPAQEVPVRDLLGDKASGLFVEAQLGQVVTCLAFVRQVKDLAAVPEISAIRLPQPARVEVSPAVVFPANTEKALELSGLVALHKKGYRGQGVRLAIIDTDFRRWDEMVQAGKLPKKTRLLDLTAERYFDLFPAPPDGDPKQLGHGTQCALAAALAAPDAELVLLRIDATAPYQIDELLRYCRGGTLSAHLDRRRDDLAADQVRLENLRATVMKERRAALEDFTDEKDLEYDFGFFGPIYGWIFSERTWSRDRVAYVEKVEQELKERARRFFALTDSIRALKGITLIASPLIWNEGYAAGGASPLSRSFDRGLKHPPLWFQAAGNSRGQGWAGLFRDHDSNGIMEFASTGALPKGRWSSELNFLGWRPWGQNAVAELPEGLRLRIVLQWREPHDPDYFAKAGAEDLYRKPLADLRLTLLRQRDPQAKSLPADAFDVVARSSGVPQRLESTPDGAVYEVVLETTLPSSGHYALRVERPVGFQWFLTDDATKGRPAFTQFPGQQSTGLRPLGVATLPALEKNWELQTRLFMHTNGPLRLQGQPVFADFATDMGSVGMPGDARTIITVGACDFEGTLRPYSGAGPVAFAELSRKPTLAAFDALGVAPKGQASAFGTSLAAPFAAGTAACLLSAGYERDALWKQLRALNGKPLRVSAQ